jgi:hypothetical protein
MHRTTMIGAKAFVFSDKAWVIRAFSKRRLNAAGGSRSARG